MATELEKVVEQALSLPGLERLSVARQILESVEPEVSEEVERAWEEEIIKRIHKIDSGTASGRSWEEIKKVKRVGGLTPCSVDVDSVGLHYDRQASGSGCASKASRECFARGDRSRVTVDGGCAPGSR